MIVAVRRSSSNVNKLQRNILSISTCSPMTSPLLPSASIGSSSSGSGTTSACGGGQIQSFDWSYVLSPENKSRAIKLLTMDRENAVFKASVGDAVDSDYRTAAVLIPLCYDVNGTPSLLYNLRSLSLSKHRGEISFPGGSLDPEDKGDPVAAAKRETHEELGIHPNSIEIWTRLRTFPTLFSRMGVIPVLGFVQGAVDPGLLLINPGEVDHAFTISLEHLCDPKNWQEGPFSKLQGHAFRMPMWKNLKVYSEGGTGSKEIHLWGLTACVTHIALLALLPEHVYQRKLPYMRLQLRTLKNNSDAKL